MYAPEKPYTVYCKDCWFSDAWDPMTYGVEYDFSRPFFEQFKELLHRTPRMNLYNRNSTNSPYTNMAVESKNVYLAYSIVHCEDIAFSKNIDRSRWIFDCLNVHDSEQCYQNIFGDHNYHSSYLINANNTMDSHYSYDLGACKNCLLCTNQRNGTYMIRNQAVSKEVYLEEAKGLGSYQIHQAMEKEFTELRQKAIHKYAEILRSVNSTGNYLNNAKNARMVFDGYDLEDVAYCFRTFAMKNSMDVSFSGIQSELVYEWITGGTQNYNTKFSCAGLWALSNVEYTDYCGSSSYLLGCTALRGREYCILNKQYDKKSFDELREKIMKHMNDMPYMDKQGRVYTYGEFFPYDLSAFAYNETIAQEYFPLTEPEVRDHGFAWREPETKNYAITKKSEELPDHIDSTNKEICTEIIECQHAAQCNEQCTSAFKITPQEFQFCKSMKVSLPRLCPNCRHFQRMKHLNLLKLYHRQCMRDGCPNEFETSYAPDRPERVYCEQCYQAEVI